MGYDGLSSATTTFTPPAVIREERRSSSAATSDQPTGPAENFAGAWLASFKAAIDNAGLAWHPPHVAGSDDEISLEWWRGHRNLTVFVRGFDVEVLLVSGPDITRDMETRILVRPEDAAAAWRWLREA